MFKDISHKLNSCAEAFRSDVRDSFGDSINKDLFEALDKDINNFQATYEEAKIQKYEIKAIMTELRLIL